MPVPKLIAPGSSILPVSCPISCSPPQDTSAFPLHQPVLSPFILASWIFRTIGYGHDYSFWKDFVSNLRMVGYDGVLSIEHEDSLMSIDEGLTKAANLLNQIVIKEKVQEMWWA